MVVIKTDLLPRFCTVAAIALLTITAQVRVCFTMAAKAAGIAKLKRLIKVAAAANCLGMFACERKIGCVVVKRQ